MQGRTWQISRAHKAQQLGHCLQQSIECKQALVRSCKHLVCHNALPAASPSLLESAAIEDIHGRFSRPFDDSHRVMRLFTWHLHPKGVASGLLQTLDTLAELLTWTFRSVPSALLVARTKSKLLPSFLY